MKSVYRRASGILWLAAVSLSAPAYANITVEATLSDSKVLVGDIVSIDIRAVASINGEITIRWPTVMGLTLVGQSSSTQMSMSWTSAGQQIRREKTLHVEVSADTPGTKKIPPIVAQVGRHRGESRPLTIEVQDPGTIDPPAVATDGDIVPPDASEKDLFVRYRVSGGEVWLGQQVLLDLEIFASPRVQFQVDTIPSPPDLDGFWRETLDRPKRLSPRQETINGTVYQVFRAWRMALFPLQSGTRTLQPATVDFRVGGRGLFGGGSRLRRRTRAVALNIKPLPTEGKPAQFSSANVGNYQLRATLEHPSVTTGKAVVLRVSLSGEGNIKSTRLPTLDALEGFRVFPPTVSEAVRIVPKGVSGEKAAEILLVPHQPGTYRIPAFALPVFTPSAGAYEVLRTQPLSLTVEGPPPPPSTTPSQPIATVDEPPDPAEPQINRRPLRFLAKLTEPPILPWRQVWWWVLLSLGPVLLVLKQLLLLIYRVAFQRGTSQAQQAAKEAQRQAKHSLHEAEQAAHRGDHPEVASACMEAFYASARGQLGVELQGKTADELSRTLREQGAPNNFAEEVMKAFEEASYARYAPISTSSDLLRIVRHWTTLTEELNSIDKRIS